MIIDSQVHAYEANTPEAAVAQRAELARSRHGDEMVATMDKVGVDGAIFISAFSLYRYDASYAVEVQRAHASRLAIVKPVDPVTPMWPTSVAEWKKTPGAVGIRIMLTKENKRAPDHPGLDRIARAAVRYDFPLNILCWDNLDAGAALIDRHPIRDSSSTISAFCSRACRRRRRSPGLTFQRCWSSPGARTR